VLLVRGFALSWARWLGVSVKFTEDVVEDEIGDLLAVSCGKQPVIEGENRLDLQVLLAVTATNKAEAGLREELHLSGTTDQEHVGAGLSQV